MMTQTAHRARPSGRMARLVGYEGAVSTMLLTSFQYFTLSVSFVVSILPVLAFHALVGWQATHVAVWLNAGSLLVVFPALFALLAAGERLLDRKADARAGRAYWSAFARAVRTLWWAPIAVFALALLLGYDAALMGRTDTVFLLIVVAGIVTATLLIAITCVALRTSELPALALTVRAARAVARPPHVALSWLLMFALAGAATTIPVLGAMAALFLPAVAGVLVHVCNRALGFEPELSEEPEQR